MASFFTLNGVDQWISTPYTGNLDIISDVEMAARVRILLGGNQTIMSGWSGNSGYMMSVNTLSNIAARHGDGSVDRFGTSSPITVPDGDLSDVGAQFDVNAGDWLFSVDGVTQPHALGLPGAGLASGIEFTIGANAGGAAGFMTGDIHVAQVRNGVGGPLVIDMNAAASGLTPGVVLDGTTWVGADGRTYTAHGGLSFTKGVKMTTLDTRPYCGQCGWDPDNNGLGDLNNDLICDACGDDLSLYGFTNVVATGATAGAPGTFTPAGATPPANLGAMVGIAASPGTAWTTGQYVVLGDATNAYWDGAAWQAGIAAFTLDGPPLTASKLALLDWLADQGVTGVSGLTKHELWDLIHDLLD